MIGKAQTRAYVNLADAKVQIVPHDGVGYGDHPKFYLEFMNSGNSPAISFECRIQVVFEYNESRGRLDGSSGFMSTNWPQDEIPIKFGRDIPAKQCSTVITHILLAYLREDDQKAFLSGGLHLFATLTTSFRDVFGNEIQDDHFLAAHFPSGNLGETRHLRSWPIGAEQFSNDTKRSFELQK